MIDDAALQTTVGAFARHAMITSPIDVKSSGLFDFGPAATYNSFDEKAVEAEARQWEGLRLVDPCTEEVFAEIPAASAADVGDAVAAAAAAVAAARAGEGWARVPVAERAAVLRRAASESDSRWRPWRRRTSPGCCWSWAASRRRSSWTISTAPPWPPRSRTAYAR
ncbi:aldehyde dehydrogenase family protein [Nonomuraea rubra]|uniref:Delta 1-pyrroline-5-carboxylate dehydrogenase n=1 Tax=Nonomuraea rubra TaxID=46180 RepID=A0A7X0NXP4_9ACTN|nr:aldehyde dehydrogenase family protein [Nonomuraea rubra]MBB6551544.1 delta 1-pyrroline-5-carboxylate dehydrogenase [Nonomuraea rubra]